EQRERPREPGLLRERVEDEVAPHDGYAVGHAVAETRPEETAVRQGVEPLHQLEARVEPQVLVEGPDPRVDASLHASDEPIGHETAEDEQAQTYQAHAAIAGRGELRVIAMTRHELISLRTCFDNARAFRTLHPHAIDLDVEHLNWCSGSGAHENYCVA